LAARTWKSSNHGAGKLKSSSHSGRRSTLLSPA
jgi:hypothetical protein